jgi:hypothetical protein
MRIRMAALRVPAWRRGLSALSALGLAALLVCGGCAAKRPANPPPDSLAPPAAGQPLSSGQLDEVTRAFADRYVGLLSSACDALKKDNPDAGQRRQAQELLVNCSANIYDIASNPDPNTRLLDLVVVTTLVSQVWIDDDRAGEVFPGRDEPLVRALRHGRVEVWAMAAKVLKPEQLDLLDYLFSSWRRYNPDMVQPYFVRFSKFAIDRGNSPDAEVVAASGLFASVGRATEEIEQTRQLTERMFYMLKREPLLTQWRVEALQDSLLANAEVGKALADLNRLTDQAGQLPAIVADERKALLSAYDARKPGLDETLAGVKAALAEANGLALTLNDMLKTAGVLAAQVQKPQNGPPAPPSRPFDIREYSDAVKELAVTLGKVDDVLKTSNTLLGSAEWDHRIQAVNQSVDERMKVASERSRQLADLIFLRVYLAIVFLFVLLLVLLLIAFKLRRRLPATARNGAGNRGSE